MCAKSRNFFPYYHNWSVCNILYVLYIILTMFFCFFFRWVHWVFLIFLETTSWVRSEHHQHFPTASFCRLDHQLQGSCLKMWFDLEVISTKIKLMAPVFKSIINIISIVYQKKVIKTPLFFQKYSEYYILLLIIEIMTFLSQLAKIYSLSLCSS